MNTDAKDQQEKDSLEDDLKGFDIQADPEENLDALRQEFYAAEELNFSYQEEQALSAYGELVQRAPDSLYGCLAAGQIASLREAPETALNEFLSAHQIHTQLLRQGALDEPEDRLGIHLGRTYRKLGKYEEAEDVLKAINPPDRPNKNPFAYAVLAWVYRSAGETSVNMSESDEGATPGKVEQYAELALSLDPTLGYAQSLLAKVYQDRGRQDPAYAQRAQELATGIIEREPRNWYVLGLLGNLLSRNNREEAIQYFERAIKVAPRREVFAKLGLAMALKSQKPPDLIRAQRLLREVLEAVPEHPTALANLGDILRLSHPEEAEPLFRKALDVLTDESPQRQLQARSGLALTLIDLGRIRAAEEVISPVRGIKAGIISTVLGRLKQERNAASELFQLAQKEEDQGHPKAAIDLYYRAVERSPRHFTCYARIFQLLVSLQDMDGALRVADEAIRAGEATGYTEKNMGDLYLSRRDLGKARYYFREALRKNDTLPTDSPLRFRTQMRASLMRDIREAADRIAAARQRRGVRPDHAPQRPQGVRLSFVNTTSRERENHDFELIRQFLPYVLGKERLPIGVGNPAPIDVIGAQPVFLIAKTGVGKTVTVPTKVLISQCSHFIGQRRFSGQTDLEEFPRVYVVVPRIPIAVSQMQFMNSVYQGFLADRGVEKAHRYNLYGCISSLGKLNANAPVVFVTTGIFESLAFNGQLDPVLSRVIIDEAHVTIEQNPGVEIGIAISRARGVTIDYMSATVDTGTLEEDLGVQIVTAGTARYPILLKNLGGRLEDHLVSLVRDYLVEPKEHLYPDRADPDFGQVTRDLLDNRARPRGMLVIVNSYAGAMSDTMKYRELLEAADFNTDGRAKVSVFAYASPVARNRRSEEQFKAQISAVEARDGLYVIVSTNVVEMGVTFDSLDYMVTMDSEFSTSFVDGGQLLEAVPLGVNALYQRIGRVGRRRAGIAFIAREIGAAYTFLSDTDLRRGLPCEPIKYPIAKGNLQKLALFSFKERWPSSSDGLRLFKLPSLRHALNAIQTRLDRERARLRMLGVADERQLTALGARCLDFLSVENMDYKRLLALAEQEGQRDLLLVIMVLAASADISLPGFMLSGTKFDVNEENGLKEGLRSNRYLRLYGPALDAQTLADTIESTHSDSLCSVLVTEGCTRTDADLIRQLLQSGFRVTAIEREDPCPEAEGASLSDNIGIFLSRNTIVADPEAEAITIYRVVSHFYNAYTAPSLAPNLSEAHQFQIEAAFDRDAYELGIDPRAVRTAIKGLRDLVRQIGRTNTAVDLGVQRGERRPAALRPSPDARRNALHAELLSRVMRGPWRDIPNEFLESLARSLGENTPDIRRDDAGNLRNVILSCAEEEVPLNESACRRFAETVVIPGLRSWLDDMRRLDFSLMPDLLPLMTERLRSATIGFISANRFGEMIEMRFSQEDPFYKVWIGEHKSETGETLPVVLRGAGTCLDLAERGGAQMRVRGILHPAWYTDVGQEPDGGQRRVFELSHITKAN